MRKKKLEEEKKEKELEADKVDALGATATAGAGGNRRSGRKRKANSRNTYTGENDDSTTQEEEEHAALSALSDLLFNSRMNDVMESKKAKAAAAAVIAAERKLEKEALTLTHFSIGRDIQVKAWEIVQLCIQKGFDPGLGRWIHKNDIKNDKHKLMDVGRMIRQIRGLKCYTQLAYGQIGGRSIPYGTLGIVPLTAKERCGLLGLAMFLDDMDELFINLFLNRKDLTQEMLNRGQAVVTKWTEWHLFFNQRMLGDQFNCCIHRYQLQGIYGVMRFFNRCWLDMKELKSYLSSKFRDESTDGQCDIHRLKIIAVHCSRITNSSTESLFSRLRVAVAHAVLSGDLIDQLWPEMVVKELMGFVKLGRALRRKDYKDLEVGADAHNNARK